VLSPADAGLYHVAGEDPQLAEALMTPREAASAAVVAQELRSEVLAGSYDADGKVPSRADLKERFGISLENASVVLRMLAAEGWVTLEQGRGSFVRPRRLFRVEVRVPRATPRVRSDETGALLTGLERSAASEPAVRGDLLPESLDAEMRVSMIVEAVDSPRAAALAYAVTGAARTPYWDWDGWDLAGASVHAEPA
jgi:DNA-binding transcriptional MocR family regulator